MRTNIEIDDALIEAAMSLTGLTTKKQTVDFALRELVAREQRLGILGLVGKIEFVVDPIEQRNQWRQLDP
jgi:Arc/MetJ family transcription regulator